MKKINPIDDLMLLKREPAGGAGQAEATWSPLLERIGTSLQEDRLSDAERALEEAEPYLSGGDEAERGVLCHLRCRLSYRQGNYQMSIEEGEAACSLLEGSRHNSLVGETRRTIAKSKVLLGLIDQAVLDFEEALLLLRKAGEVTLGLYAINDLAQVYFIQGKWQLTRELLERGLRDASCHGDGLLMYFFTMNLGTLCFTRGKITEAREHFERCTEMLGEGGGRKSCRLHIMKGNLELLTENLNGATDHFARASRIAQELGLKREMVLAFEGSADVAMEIGDLAGSEELLTAALEIAGTIAPRGDLVSELLRRKGDNALRQGKLSEAKENLERSIAISLHIGDRLEEGAAAGLMGEVFCKMGKATEARIHFERATVLLSDLVEKWERARLLLRAASALRELHGTQSVADECLEYLEKASDLFDELELTKSKARVDLETGLLLFDLGEYDRAGALAVRARDNLDSTEMADACSAAQKLIEEIEQILARRSIQRSEDLNAGDFAYTVSSDMEEVRRRAEKRLDIIRERCGIDSACIVDLDSDKEPVFTVMSMMDSDEATVLINQLLELKEGEDVSVITVINVSSSTRFGSVADLTQRKVSSFLLWSSQRTGNITRHLYLERHDPRRGVFRESNLILIELLAKEIMLDGSILVRESDKPGRKTHPDQRSEYRGIITRNHQFLNVLETVDKIKDSSIPVLLEGETGTGKELVARAIHEKSRRLGREFCAVNCAAIPEHLLESELFGHRRGAFTGAIRDKVGLIEAADGGTFFLDEIGDMSRELQVKLLRFLEEGEFKRLGDIEVRAVDVRVVSATNKILTEEVALGTFREDLYYRLNGIRIQIPPLRKRKEDIPHLVEWYLNKYVREEGKRIRGMRRDALKMFLCFDWPGNVRELINEIHRAFTLAEEGSWICPASLSDTIKEYGKENNSWLVAPGVYHDSTGIHSDLSATVAIFERQKILDAMRANRGIKLRAAHNLGLHEATLRGKIKKYGIGRSEWEV